MTHALSLRPAVHLTTRRGRFGRVRSEPVAHYLELLVDGVPLDRRVAHGSGMVTPLQPGWLTYSLPVIDDLLGSADTVLPTGFAPIRHLAPGRAPLLVCPWDDDVHCGWLTAEVRVGDTVVGWHDFRWENGGIGVTGPVQGLPAALEFDRAAYEATLERARDEVAVLPEASPDRDSWRDDQPVPGVPRGMERWWGTWTRLRHRHVGP